MDTKILLKQLGFNKKEQLVLFYLFKKGKGIASQISDEINIPKSTVLFVLYNLEEKGIVEKKKEGKRYIFKATDPSILLNLFDSQLDELKQKRESLAQNIPQIRKLKDQKADNSIAYYDKAESIKELRQSLLEQLDNNDLKEIYSKNTTRVLTNEDYTFLLSDDLAIRFEDRKTLIKFILNFKYINAHEIKT